MTAAHTYFRQSEQLPTFIRLAVARHYGPAAGSGARAWHWRAGGLMIQQLAREGGKRELEGEAHDLSLDGDDDENWNRARHLAATVEDHELLDPMLSPERLLYRLFHEEGVRVVPAMQLSEACRCSRERIEMYLARFGADELKDLREAGRLHLRDLRVLLAQVRVRAGRVRVAACASRPSTRTSTCEVDWVPA